MIRIQSNEVGVFLGDYYCSLPDYLLDKNGSSLYAPPKRVSNIKDNNEHHLKNIKRWLETKYDVELENVSSIADKELDFLDIKLNAISNNGFHDRRCDCYGKTGILIKYSADGFNGRIEERYKAEALLCLDNYPDLVAVVVCRVSYSYYAEDNFINYVDAIHRNDIESVKEIRSVIKETYDKYFVELEQLSLQDKEKVILSRQEEMMRLQTRNRERLFSVLGLRVQVIPHELYEQVKQAKEDLAKAEARFEELRDKVTERGDLECIIFTDRGQRVASIFLARYHFFDDKSLQNDYPALYKKYYKPGEKLKIMFDDWRNNT